MKKLESAKEIKKERKKDKKKLSRLEKYYIRKAQEKRFEQQVIQEANKIKMEQ